MFTLLRDYFRSLNTGRPAISLISRPGYARSGIRSPISARRPAAILPTRLLPDGVRHTRTGSPLRAAMHPDSPHHAAISPCLHRSSPGTCAMPLRRALLLHGGPDNRTLTRRSARLLVRDEASLRPAELDDLCLLVPGWAKGSCRCGGAGRVGGGLFSQDVAQDLACGVA